MCVATAALAGSQIIGGISQGEAAAYQGKVAKNNAIIARQQQAASAQAESANSERAGLKSAAEQSGLRTSLAANGIDVNSGSAAAVQQSERGIGMSDTLNVARKGALETYGYGARAQSYSAESKLAGYEAPLDVLMGGLSGAGAFAGAKPQTSLISGNPNLGENYQWMQNTGDFETAYG